MGYHCYDDEYECDILLDNEQYLFPCALCLPPKRDPTINKNTNQTMTTTSGGE